MAEFRRQGDIRVHDTHVAVWEEEVDRAAMNAVYRATRGHLYRRGFALNVDRTVGKCIQGNYHFGQKRDLELHTEVVGRVVKVDFYQNVANVENRNGGRYDFDRLRKMPRHIRLQCVVEMVNVIRFFQGMGYTLDPKLRHPLALALIARAERREEDALSPLELFNHRWGADRFRRGADGWPVESEYTAYDWPDRDKVRIRPGEIRYVYDRYRGRLLRGIAYPCMNSNWTLHAPDGSVVAWCHAQELFYTDRPELLPRKRRLSAKEADERLRRELTRETEKQNWRRVSRVGHALHVLSAAQ